MSFVFVLVILEITLQEIAALSERTVLYVHVYSEVKDTCKQEQDYTPGRGCAVPHPCRGAAPPAGRPVKDQGGRSRRRDTGGAATAAARWGYYALCCAELPTSQCVYRLFYCTVEYCTLNKYKLAEPLTISLTLSYTPA
jgi:hypothetical protein